MLEDLSAPFEKVGGREIEIVAGPRSAMVQDRKKYALAWAAWTAPEWWWRWGTEDHEPAQRYPKEKGSIINDWRKSVVEDFRQYLKDQGTGPSGRSTRTSSLGCKPTFPAYRPRAAPRRHALFMASSLRCFAFLWLFLCNLLPGRHLLRPRPDQLHRTRPHHRAQDLCRPVPVTPSVVALN